MQPTIKRMPRLLLAALVSAVLFGLFSIARECLVPRNADFDRACWRLTGDEPAYLLTAQAIAQGDGEDVSRVRAAQSHTNFQSRKVLRSTQFTWRHYRKLGCPFWIDRSASWGETKQVIQRPPLIAAFAAPFARSANRPRWKILFAQGLFAAICAGLLVLLAAEDTRRVPIFAAIACLATFGGMPTLYYTAEIYPEVLMGCLLALSMMLWRRRTPILRWLSLLPFFASLWGSGRVVPAAVAASLAMAVQELQAKRFSTLVPIAAGWLAYFGYNLWLWGYPVPPAPPNGGTLTLARIPVGLAENFFGNDVGLFLLCPAALVGAACCVAGLMRHRDDPATIPSAILFAGVALVVSSFSNPRAGTCPAGRYQVVQAILLLVPTCIFFARERSGSRLRRAFAAALCVLGAITLAMGVTVAIHPRWWFEHFHPFFKIAWIQRFYRFLPDFPL